MFQDFHVHYFNDCYSCQSRSPPTFSERVERHLLALGKFPSASGGAWPDGLADEGSSERFTRRCQLCPQGWVDADLDGSLPRSIHCCTQLSRLSRDADPDGSPPQCSLLMLAQFSSTVSCTQPSRLAAHLKVFTADACTAAKFSSTVSCALKAE